MCTILNVTVLDIPERLEFKTFFRWSAMVADYNFQCFMAPTLQINFAGPENKKVKSKIILSRQLRLF